MVVTQDPENRIERLKKVSEDSYGANLESNKYWNRKTETPEGYPQEKSLGSLVSTVLRG